MGEGLRNDNNVCVYIHSQCVHVSNEQYFRVIFASISFMGGFFSGVIKSHPNYKLCYFLFISLSLPSFLSSHAC